MHPSSAIFTVFCVFQSSALFTDCADTAPGVFKCVCMEHKAESCCTLLGTGNWGYARGVRLQWVYFEILSQVPIALATAGLPCCHAATLLRCHVATLPGCHSYPINQTSSQACQRRAKVKSCSDIKCAKPWPNRVTVNKENILTKIRVNDFSINTL